MRSYDIPDAPWVRDPTHYDGSEGIGGIAYGEDCDEDCEKYDD